MREKMLTIEDIEKLKNQIKEQNRIIEELRDSNNKQIDIFGG